MGNPAGSGVHEGPCRVWGPQRIMPGLRVFIGECAVSTPSLESPPPQGSRFRAAAMGQGPFPVRTPLPPRRRPQDPGPAGHWWDRTPHWDSGAAFTGPCASLSGDRGGAGSLRFRGPWTVISTLDHAPCGAASRRGLVLTTAPFVSHQAGFLGLL